MVQMRQVHICISSSTNILARLSELADADSQSQRLKSSASLNRRPEPLAFYCGKMAAMPRRNPHPACRPETYLGEIVIENPEQPTLKLRREVWIAWRKSSKKQNDSTGWWFKGGGMVHTRHEVDQGSRCVWLRRDSTIPKVIRLAPLGWAEVYRAPGVRTDQICRAMETQWPHGRKNEKTRKPS